ncbi:MAG: T9SS type A sorting domain-containing protein [Saprospiraceae bacterium]
MKRLLTNYLTIIIVLAFILLNNELKAQSLDLKFLENYSYSDTLAVPIYLDSVIEVGAITTGLNFNNAEVTLIDIVKKSDQPGTIFYNQQGNEVILAWFSLNPITVSDTFAIVYFKKKQEVCNTEFDWTILSNQLVSNVLGVPISTNYIGGTGHYIKEESPNLVFPALNATSVPINTQFRWYDYDLSCVANYRYQIATDSNFTQVEIDTLLEDSTYAAVGLQELTDYHWRVGKVDAAGNVYWSTGQSITTKLLDTIDVKIQEIYSYVDTIIVPVTIQNSEYIGHFDLAMNIDTAALEYIGYSNLLNTDITVVDSTNHQIELHWQTSNYPIIFPSDTLIELMFLEKSNCGGAITWDTSSQWNNFYFIDNFSIASQLENGFGIAVDTISPTLIYPQDSAQQVFIRPKMTWQTVGCSDNYRLQIAWDENMTNILTDTLLSDTILTPFNLQGDTTYYWRVAYLNIFDSTYWSDVWEFRTENVLPVYVNTPDLVVENDTFLLPIIIDSLQNSIAFELFLQYDSTAIAFVNTQDSLTLSQPFQINSDSNGLIKILWQAANPILEDAANIIHDTLIQLRFVQLSSCQTALTWNVDTSDFYHINSNINLDAFYQNSTITFLENEVPTQVLPLDGDTTLLHPELFWNDMICVEQYHLEIALDDQFTQVVLDTVQNDTANWLTNLQPNTKYFWRVAKEDYVGDLFWSDTLTFITGDVYNTELSISNILTYADTVTTFITIDSSFYTTEFQLFLTFDDTQMSYYTHDNPLFNLIQVSENNGIIELQWQDNIQPRFVISDTLIALKFINKNACITPVNWLPSVSSFNYRSNAISNTVIYSDATFEFLNTRAPILELPANQQTNVSTLADFNWQTADCTVDYQFQIARDNQFTNIVIDNMNVVDTFVNQIELNHGTTYYWRVGRWDTQNDRYWSDTFQLTTQSLPVVTLKIENVISYSDTLIVPVLVEDVVNTRAFQLALEFDTLAFQFLDIINPLVNFQTTIDSQIVVNWSSNIDLSITLDTLLKLRFLQQTDCYSDIIINSNNTYFQYRDSLVPTIIDAFDGSMLWVNDEDVNLQFPPNDTTFLIPNFEMTWNSILCAESYHLQVATDNNFTNIVLNEFNINVTSFAISNLDFNQKYYWKIAQEDSQGNEHWSEIWNFKTDRINDQDYTIYPNPTLGEVRFWFANYSNTNANITVFNSIGQLMLQKEIVQRGKSFVLDLTRFNNGIYMVQYDDGITKWIEKVIVFK